MWESVDRDWSKRELGEIELGDKRLEHRARRTAEELSKKPECPINQASADWSASKAAYRLFDNKKVTSAKILSPHRARTLERMRTEPVVLVIQDTTYLNYSTHECATGLGPIGDQRTKSQGLIMHSALALTPAGLPLGFLGQKIWARDGYRKTKGTHKQKPLARKESSRWIEMLQETSKFTRSVTQIVTICDRESDIYEFFGEAEKLRAPFIVRAAWDRHLRDEQHSNLWEMLQAQPVAGRTTVELPNRSIIQAKELDLDVRFTQITLKPPQRISRDSNKLGDVTLYAVHARQTNAKSDTDPVEWLLLMNLPVQTLEQALEKLAWYTRRWAIEVFHRILKSGCTVEKCRLETAARLMRYLTLMSVVAWRIFWITHFRRTDPKAPASQVLTKNELCALPLLFKKPPYASSRMPTVAQIVVAIARLGGFLARKGDGDPGPTAIWRGWQRLADGATLLGAINAR